MNKTIKGTNWQTFKDNLSGHEELGLLFQYAKGRYVNKSYHITEIKQAVINSVDCGGVQHNWTEIIVQLWVPEERQQEEAMRVKKALSIIDIVEKKMPLPGDGIVKIEYGNSDFDTRQMYPNEFSTENGNFIVDLVPDLTQCKAGAGNCGHSKPAQPCCRPQEEARSESANQSAQVCCVPAGHAADTGCGC